jgi:hypothetical protein
MNYNNFGRFDYHFYCTETPNTSLGNFMYLNSFEAGDSKITTNSDGYLINSSSIYVINQFMKPFIPVIVKNKHKQMVRYMNALSLRHITFQLCDKYNVPIILKSPLLVSIIISTT